MTTVTLSLVSHTNVGKTTLARTLLRQDIGEVRDAPHVTEFETSYDLVSSDAGDLLRLWDTPGFSDAARLLRRMRLDGHALGWLLSEVWDRWRDRAFWSSQRALRHVQAESDVVLYLVNAAESPAAAAYVDAEMELLAWVGKPILVLLNQLGAPREAAAEAADGATWRAHLQRWPRVRAVLPLDAFARCWVHERKLLATVQGLLEGEAAAAMARLARAWSARGESVFAASMQTLAQSLARVALERETIAGDSGWAERLRRVGAAVARREDPGPLAAAQRRLAAALEAEAAAALERLIALHGLQGRAQAEIVERVEGQFAQRLRVPEGRAAVVGGAVSGAALGLKADIATGGLTLGGGVLLGALLGALGGAGIARGINLVRGTDSSWVAWSDEALDAALQ
ncbi:MAG: GTPase domain-containing protein, partial [Burkholderiales bacterium]|nr:GTPase domain-containing protein [Burkholderiales bacterium]